MRGARQGGLSNYWAIGNVGSIFTTICHNFFLQSVLPHIPHFCSPAQQNPQCYLSSNMLESSNNQRASTYGYWIHILFLRYLLKLFLKYYFETRNCFFYCCFQKTPNNSKYIWAKSTSSEHMFATLVWVKWKSLMIGWVFY